MVAASPTFSRLIVPIGPALLPTGRRALKREPWAIQPVQLPNGREGFRVGGEGGAIFIRWDGAVGMAERRRAKWERSRWERVARELAV